MIPAAGIPTIPLVAETFRPEALTTCTVLRLTDREPSFVEFMDEGDVAYWGLVLQAEGGDAIRDYLLSAAVDGLWEYHRGYGPTSADSALVLEGLFERGAAREALESSLRRLVALFYDAEAGAFRTVLEGRAAYWRGPQVETTAHCAYLLHRIAPDLFVDEISRSAAYVAARQNADGSFPGRWFPSRAIPVLYALRLIRSAGGRDGAARRAEAFLASAQAADGSWMGGVVETAAAVIALAPSSAHAAAVERGRTFIRSRRRTDGWDGEPVLYYWFEENDGSKLLHVGRDKGRVTSAWARLALP